MTIFILPKSGDNMETFGAAATDPFGVKTKTLRQDLK